LHGAFDFALMSYSLVSQIISPEGEEDSETTQRSPGGGEGEMAEEMDSSMLMVSCVMLIPLIGVLYYFKEAWNQRERLEALDKEVRATV
jgi:hypothetical protein